MHNGSVPNLYEMLIPAKERTKKFYIGREFDPVKVGLDTSGDVRDLPSGYDAARKFERRSLLRGWPARKRHHRTVADRRSALGACRVSEIHSRGTRPRHAVRRAAGRRTVSTWADNELARSAISVIAPSCRPLAWSQTARIRMGVQRCPIISTGRDRSAIPRPISLICSHSRARKIRRVPCSPRTSFRRAGSMQSSRTRSIIRSSFVARKWPASATPPNSRQPTRKYASVAGSTHLNAARRTASPSSAVPAPCPMARPFASWSATKKGHPRPTAPSAYTRGCAPIRSSSPG